MPPGTSMVTPTRSPISTASARVKPTTPNLLAQYAVAAGSALSPSVEATVTTRPRERSRYGSAARTTAAVPSRLTAMTRSQASGSTSPMSSQASVPAAVTSASSPPCASATRRTAASASRGCERSTCTSAAGSMSSTTGVPPSAATAAAAAAPSPDAPPVTSTVPTSATAPRDQGARRTSGDVGHDHGLAAPLGQRGRLRQVAHRVVAALGPQVRAQLAEDRTRVVLLEDGDGVHAAERGEHGPAVVLADQRPVRALQARDRRIGVQAHDQAVAEAAGGGEHADVAGVQQVEAAARGHHGAAGRADARGERDGAVGTRLRRRGGRGGG